jgi:hypothetical protein
MIKVIQANCRASEDIMTALMAAAVRAGAEMVLVQEPSMKQEEDKWVAKIRDGNYVYIYSDSGPRPYVLTAVRKDIIWKDYGGSRNPERVGIEIRNTRVINIYHHREKTIDIASIRVEIRGIGGRNGSVLGISIVITASGMEMEGNQLEAGERLKKSLNTDD